MADASIVQGLFGVDPVLYQMGQQARQEDQALQFAQLDPFQKASFGLYRGGQQLGNLGANLMGVQDPMLQKASMAHELAGKFDLSTPDGLKQYAAALASAGAPDLAVQANAAAQKMLESQATITSKTREHLSTLGKMQSERDRLLNAGLPANDPRIVELTNAIKSEGSSKAPQLSLNMKMFDAAAGRRDAFLKEVDPLIKQGSAVNQALTLVNEGTPFAQAAFENTVVSAFGGDKQKSVSEIKRLINTGDLPTRVENSLRKFVEGKISDATTEDQKNVLEAVQGGLKRQYNSKQQSILKASSSVPELKGQEDFYAPTWESSVGGGASRGQKAYTVGETLNSKEYGVLKVTKVDPVSGKILEAVDSKGNVGVPK